VTDIMAIREQVQPGRHPAGFSLVELLVVLVMLGILAGVTAPAVGRYYDNLEYRKQVEGTAAYLRYARLMAVTRGKQVKLTLGDDSDESILQLKGAVERQHSAGSAERFAIQPEEIIFHPEGRATPGRIIFTRGERSQTILVDPLTGLPVLQ
jgi:general secretion pathway protein H